MPNPFRRRTLDSLKHEAKRWLAAIHAGDAEAQARLRRALPPAVEAPTLRDVQLALAREHGFEGWTALKRALAPDAAVSAATLTRYDAMADALLEAYRTGTPEAMERHYGYTWHRRPWSAMRTYVQLDLGKRSSGPDDDVEITLDDARYLVARERGLEGWDALRASVAAMPGGAPHVMTVAEAKARRLREALADETVTELDFSGVREITDDAMPDVARLRHLQRLNLAGTSVTDAGVAHLRPCAALREVDLSWTRTGNDAIRALAGNPDLHTFRSGLLVTDAGLALFREWPAFATWQGGTETMGLTSYDAGPTYLMLRGAITDGGLRQLAGLDGLFALNIDDAALPITAEGIAALAALPHLGWLAVDARDDWMAPIAALPRLRFLGAQDTIAGDDGFAALARSRSIEYIWGRRCHNLRRRGFVALSDMPALRALSVSCLNVDDEGIAALPHFPALRELMPMDVPDAGYRHIGRCADLESLVLMYCRETTDAATEHITGLSKLTSYFNSYTTITDRTPQLLSTMDSLERITFDTCHDLTDGGVGLLARLPRLREVSVSGRGISAAVRGLFPSSVVVHRYP
jgi:hypothetical protein